MAYRYILDNKKPRKKFTCPSCGKLKAFVRYIDTLTGDYLPEEYGLCDRLDNCTYSLNPYKDGYYKKIKEQEKGNTEIRKIHKPVKKAVQEKESVIHPEIFKHSLKEYEHNNFVTYLINKFGSITVTKLIERYYIATSKNWNGATVFWQIDINGKIRTGKVMLYNPETGKRVKEPYPHINWVHTLLKLPDYNVKQCLFGEHLLNGNNTPVGIVESEKTAIIASCYFPDLLWLATGSKTGISEEKCKVLKGRNVTLYPDLNGFEKWSEKAKELSTITRFAISDLLETKASETDKKQGLDLADYLLQFDYKTVLKDLFKNEFLRKDELLPELQCALLKDYLNRGLQPIDAKVVMNELLNINGFIKVKDKPIIV